MAKVKTGICDYNIGIFLKIFWRVLHDFLYQNENQCLSEEVLCLLTFCADSYSCIFIISQEESTS